PKELDLHLIIDNYATHKHPTVQHWLKAHSRFHIHFTPTSSSWLNLVERFFGELTSEVVREGSFESLRELVRAIESYLAERNQNPKKYVWRASGLEILEKIRRARSQDLLRIQRCGRREEQGRLICQRGGAGEGGRGVKRV